MNSDPKGQEGRLIRRLRAVGRENEHANRPTEGALFNEAASELERYREALLSDEVIEAAAQAPYGEAWSDQGDEEREISQEDARAIIEAALAALDPKHSEADR